MEFKGTKGKWEVMEYNTGLETKVMCGIIRIAEAKHYNHGDDDWTVNDPIEIEGKANAQLISKAPEMLEALKYSLRMLKNNKSVADYQYIENLIKEATTIE